MEAGAYMEEKYWTEAGWHWRCKEDIMEPYTSGAPWNFSNRPVVDVTWYEAAAYCRWLTEMWRGARLLPGDWEVRLPSEAEWEKAARGGREIPASLFVGRISQKIDVELKIGTLKKNFRSKAIYPWGDEPDTNLANYDETGIGTTSAVGCFPAGISPYGCLDMAGNVWEWTRSISKEYPYDPKDGREDLKAGDDVPRVRRGGAFIGSEWLMRCACRWDLPMFRSRSFGFRVVLSL